jgi:hypothetical protein
MAGPAAHAGHARELEHAVDTMLARYTCWTRLSPCTRLSSMALFPNEFLPRLVAGAMMVANDRMPLSSPEFAHVVDTCCFVIVGVFADEGRRCPTD